MNIRSFWKENALSLALMTVTGVILTVTGIVYKQDVLRMLPLYVSLVVGVFQAAANRYTNLIGGLNCFLYAVSLYSVGLYGSVINTLFVSCPLQFLTFIRWSKHKYKHSTKFQKLTGKWRLILLFAFVVAFIGYSSLLRAAGSQYSFLDSFSSLLGIPTSILCLLSFIEYAPLSIVSSVSVVLLYIEVMLDQPAHVTYLVYAVYALICVIRQYFSVRKLYAEQKAEEAAVQN